MTRRTTLSISCAVGLLFAGFVIHAAWDHNPQGAYHGEDGVAVFHLLSLAVFWGVPVAFFTMVILESVAFVVDFFRRRS